MTGRRRENPGRWAVLCVFGAALAVGGCAGLGRTTWSGEPVSQIVVHTVSDGETLISIADDYYGDPRGALYLAERNDIPADTVLERGAVIDVPVGPGDLDRYARRTEAKAHYNRGTLLASEGDLARSEDAFRRALELDPRFIDAAYNLGVVLLAEGEAGRAVTLLEQAAAVRPDDADVQFALGKALFDDGRTGTASERFAAAVLLDPELEEAAYALGLSLLASGRREEGVVALDAYLRRFPEGTWASDARRRLASMANAAEGAP